MASEESRQYRINKFVDGLIPISLSYLSVLSIGLYAAEYIEAGLALAVSASLTGAALAWIHSCVMLNGGWNGE